MDRKEFIQKSLLGAAAVAVATVVAPVPDSVVAAGDRVGVLMAAVEVW